jgi:hypothetical protein
MKYFIVACLCLFFGNALLAQAPIKHAPIKLEPMIIKQSKQRLPSATTAMSLPSSSAQATKIAFTFVDAKNWAAADSVLSRALTQIDDKSEQIAMWLERVKIAKMAVESSFSPKSAEKGKFIAQSLDGFLTKNNFPSSFKTVDNIALAKKYIVYFQKVDVDFLKIQKELFTKQKSDPKSPF